MVAGPAPAAAGADGSLLVVLVQLIDRIPLPDPPPRRGRGRPAVYPDRLFLKALVVMVVKRLPKVGTVLAVLAQETPEAARLRALLTDERGRFPSRRTWERRLRAVPDALPAQIACLGRHLAAALGVWATCGRAAAIDSTPLRARGGEWHKRDREAGVVPHSSIDTEAGWTRSGWHGWVYGWKLHLVVTVAAVWLPLAADLTPANVADNEHAPVLLAGLPPDLRLLLGDRGYADGDLRERCAARDLALVTARPGAYPHADGGVEVRRVFHRLRSRAIENCHGHLKDLFGCGDRVPTRGLVRTRRFVLGAVLVYQLALLHRHERGLPLDALRVGLKPYLLAA